ncbi:MAG: hypothetical protein GSR85_04140 [Desulfurococcales archaeon]|nr:hypothetical protein [Desulfurococcales archaeon]
MLGFSVSRMLLAGVILLLLALFLSALSLQVETYDIELATDIPMGAEDSLIKLFNIDLKKSYSTAHLTLYNNGEEPVRIILIHPTGVVSRYTLDSSDKITIEIINLLSKLRIDPINDNKTSIYGVMKLTVVENRYAWLSIPGFIAFIAGTVLASIGIMTYWMERGFKGK